MIMGLKRLFFSSLRFFLIVACVVFANSAFGQKWDAATCADICNIVVDGGYNIDEILQSKCGYEHLNNMNAGDDGFLALYALNAQVDIYGNLIGLSKTGVSSIVMAHLNSGSCKIIIGFFSSANAKRFRDQAFELGFVKSKTSGKNSYYVLDNLSIEESTDKIGCFTAYEFMIQLDDSNAASGAVSKYQEMQMLESINGQWVGKDHLFIISFNADLNEVAVELYDETTDWFTLCTGYYQGDGVFKVTDNGAYGLGDVDLIYSGGNTANLGGVTLSRKR